MADIIVIIEVSKQSCDKMSSFQKATKRLQTRRIPDRSAQVTPAGDRNSRVIEIVVRAGHLSSHGKRRKPEPGGPSRHGLLMNKNAQQVRIDRRAGGNSRPGPSCNCYMPRRQPFRADWATISAWHR
ncbi:MAG: hypothetical protein IPK79_06875 [Vampirovibrionales bacterium]|nr:hypothetical protein [Vampirovibrionales bacterium]